MLCLNLKYRVLQVAQTTIDHFGCASGSRSRHMSQSAGSASRV